MNLLQGINGLVDHFQPSSDLIEKLSVGQFEGKRHCRLSVMAGLFLSLMIIIIFLIRVYLEGIVSVSLFAILGASLVCLSVSFFIKYTANYQLANIILLTLPLAILPVRVLETGGFGSAVLSWYLISCMIFFMVGSIWLGLVASLMTFFELCVIYFALEQGWGDTNYTPPNDVQFWVFSIALFTGIGVIYWYERQRIANIATLKEKNKKISSDNKLLIQQKIELNKVNMDKSTLLNVLCHDIANPLQVISGYVEMFEKQDDAEKKEKYIKNISKAVTVINQITSHVRSVQSADLQNSGLKLIPVNLAKYIKQAFFVFEHKLQNKNITMIIDEESLSEIEVLAEPVSLSNFVINNIISNAIKFSDEGGEIEISSHKEEGLVCLKIKDEGIGMAPELVESLFLTNKVSSRQGTNGEEGSGLGMKVISSYLSAYGGHMRIESTPMENGSKNHGAIFYLYLNEA